MNVAHITSQSILGLTAIFFLTAAQAGAPVVNFKLNGSPVINSDTTATVSYTITNNSKKPHRLALSSTPTGIVNSSGLCVVAGKTQANPNPTCTLTLSINGSALPSNHLTWAPTLCEANPNGSPNANQCFEPCHEKLDITRSTTPGTATLSTSIAPPSILALSVKNTGKNPALTGNARYITFTNTGTVTATGLVVTANGLPVGSNVTTVPTTCTGTLAPNATCTVTITPGIDSTSDCKTGIEPTSGTITLSANNVASPAVSNVAVLDYGCIYQGGFLFSVDDTTNNGITGTCTTPPCTKSMGGKVLSVSDLAHNYMEGAFWSSNGEPGAVGWSYDIIPGIDTNSNSSNSSPSYSLFLSMFDYPANPNGVYTNGEPNPALEFIACNGSKDGACNTQNILLFYSKYTTQQGSGCDPNANPLNTGCTVLELPTQNLLYASGLCSSYAVGGYSNWYLPAICEMGPDYGSQGICDTSNVEQNIANNLSFLIGNQDPCTTTECLSGLYWSSTESALDPAVSAYAQYFLSNNIRQDIYQKSNRFGVRCSRYLS